MRVRRPRTGKTSVEKFESDDGRRPLCGRLRQFFPCESRNSGRRPYTAILSATGTIFNASVVMRRTAVAITVNSFGSPGDLGFCLLMRYRLLSVLFGRRRRVGGESMSFAFFPILLLPPSFSNVPL